MKMQDRKEIFDVDRLFLSSKGTLHTKKKEWRKRVERKLGDDEKNQEEL